MMHKNINQTEILKIMIDDGGCTVQDAMNVVRRGADPDTKGSNGNSLLHCLVKSKHGVQVKDLVLKYHANVDIKNAKELTPLQCILNYGSQYSVEDAMNLVRLGADPDTKGSNGNSLLHCLVKGSQTASIKELVQTYHANVNITAANDLTPLRWLINNGGTVESAMNLIHLGADPDTKGSNGTSLLHCLVKNKHDAQVKELVLKYHASVDIKNAKGLTPLQCILNDGSQYSVGDAMNLVRLGACPDTKDSNGNSLLHYLVKGHQIPSIKQLVQTYHANVNITGANGLTPLRWLINNGGTVESAMNLIHLGADPNTKGSNGDPLLHCLVKGKYAVQINELVLTYHVNVDTMNAIGLTPLQCILNDGSKYSVGDAMNLVRLGADPDTRGSDGDTLLRCLQRRYHHTQITELNQLQVKYSTKKYLEPRNNFLNLLLLLVNERENKYSYQECSYFKSLHIDIICYIISFLDFESMGKSWKEGVALTADAYKQHQKIKTMFATPGGINVFQQNHHQTNQPAFTFFKSAQTLCVDFAKLKSHLKHTQKHTLIDTIRNKELTSDSGKQLSEFSKKYAVAYWKEHSALFNNSVNKQKLLNCIKDNEPYNNSKIKSQLKLR